MKTSRCFRPQTWTDPATTVSPKTPDHRPDPVQRNFRTQAPGRGRAAKITYVRTLSGFAYTACVVDVFSRKIVGVATRSTMRTDALPIKALEHALTTAGTNPWKPINSPQRSGQSTVFTKRNSLTPKIRGRRSEKSNWPPCGGCIGKTPSVFTKHGTTPPHRK